MAVPKKRTSKMKKNLRKSVWKKQPQAQALKALSLGKSLLSSGSSLPNTDSSVDTGDFQGFRRSSD